MKSTGGHDEYLSDRYLAMDRCCNPHSCDNCNDIFLRSTRKDEYTRSFVLPFSTARVLLLAEADVLFFQTLFNESTLLKANWPVVHLDELPEILFRSRIDNSYDLGIRVFTEEHTQDVGQQD